MSPVLLVPNTLSMIVVHVRSGSKFMHPEGIMDYELSSVNLLLPCAAIKLE